MITEIFSRRYEHLELRPNYYEEDRRFFNQAAAMILDPLWSGHKAEKISSHAESSLKDTHDTLAHELGREYLSDRFWFHNYTYNGNQIRQAHTHDYATICKNFLIKFPDDLANAGSHIKDRMSLIELAFRLRWQQIQTANTNLPKAIAEAERFDANHGIRIRLPGIRANELTAANAKRNEAFHQLAAELNERLRLAKHNLSFHNGILQIADDSLLNHHVSQPFWSIITDQKWHNVENQMKEALDRRDRRDRTAAFHAVCALESCIKIISDTKGWTTGQEKGASNYVDNLTSKKNGRFIDVWEAEMLKSMFGDIRNPFAHGPGQEPMPELKPAQTDWTISTSMSWIRGLIARL